MAAQTNTFSVGQIIAILVSMAILVLGILFLTATLDANQFTIWLPVVLILSGLLILPQPHSKQDEATNTAQTTAIAMALVGLGGFVLLRQMGIIDTSILRYGVGAFLVGVGIYGIFKNLNRVMVDKSLSE